MDLKDKKLFLLDMDGTLYLSDRLFDGTLEFLDYVRRSGGRAIFMTNNSSRGLEGYLKRMEGLGIACSAEDFVTSTDAAIRYLKNTYDPETRYFVCGTESLKGQLHAVGLSIAEESGAPGSDPGDLADVVLLGYDTELTYRKLEVCCILLSRGKDYIATHPDMVCPVWFGSVPDCGSVIEMLATATGRRPLVIGKPQPAMALLAMEKTGFGPEETVVIGDRIYTDIACGVNAGVDTVFVLSGEGVPADIEKYGVRPTYVCNGIRDVLNALKKEDPA